MRLPRALEPLRHRDFRLLWTGQTVSMVGNFIHGVALPFQILALGGGALELGLWSAIFSASMLVVVLLAGAIVDRVPRRRVILASDLVAGLVVSAVTVLATAGQLRIEHLYVEAAIFGATESFLWPALSALIPELVPASILQAGNALRGSSRQVSLLAGPVIGGLLVAARRPRWRRANVRTADRRGGRRRSRDGRRPRAGECSPFRHRDMHLWRRRGPCDRRHRPRPARRRDDAVRRRLRRAVRRDRHPLDDRRPEARAAASDGTRAEHRLLRRHAAATGRAGDLRGRDRSRRALAGVRHRRPLRGRDRGLAPSRAVHPQPGVTRASFALRNV